MKNEAPGAGGAETGDWGNTHNHISHLTPLPVSLPLSLSPDLLRPSLTMECASPVWT